MNNRTMTRIGKVVTVVGVTSVIVSAAIALAKPPVSGSGCPRRGIFCLDVYQPVDCINRFGQPQTYSNSCYAYVDCATGCVDGSAR